MKTILSILTCSILLLGCSRQNPPPQPQAKYETKTMTWGEFPATTGFTNNVLLIFDGTNTIASDVYSLDDAANVLGQYGWEFAGSEVVNGNKSYHMKRQVRTNGEFDLIIGISNSAADFQK